MKYISMGTTQYGLSGKFFHTFEIILFCLVVSVFDLHVVNYAEAIFHLP